MSKYENQMKYDKKNTKDIRLKLNINTDKDILDFLEKSGNKQGTIKEALRKYMEDLKMIIIERSNDKEAWFDDLEKAKEYMIPTEELSEEDYLCDDFENYAKNFEEYKAELKGAESLEELADVWNKYTDTFNDGSKFEVREVK